MYMISCAVSAYLQGWRYLVMCARGWIGMLEQLECIFIIKLEAVIWILKTNEAKAEEKEV